VPDTFRARDDIDDLVDWQLSRGRARRADVPSPLEMPPPDLSRPGLLGLLRDAVVALVGRR
jgi:hypothetical protein